LTDHQLGVFHIIISYKKHLIADAVFGIVFLIAPFVFSFKGLDAWVNGVVVLAVVSLHKPE